MSASTPWFPSSLLFCPAVYALLGIADGTHHPIHSHTRPTLQTRPHCTTPDDRATRGAAP